VAGSKPHPGDQQAVEDLALSMARDTHREVYDPAKQPHDEMLDAEIQEEFERFVPMWEQATEFADADVAEREEEAPCLSRTAAVEAIKAPYSGWCRRDNDHGWHRRYTTSCWSWDDDFVCWVLVSRLRPVSWDFLIAL